MCTHLSNIEQIHTFLHGRDECYAIGGHPYRGTFECLLISNYNMAEVRTCEVEKTLVTLKRS
jgi:hypothetical protein